MEDMEDCRQWLRCGTEGIFPLMRSHRQREPWKVDPRRSFVGRDFLDGKHEIPSQYKTDCKLVSYHSIYAQKHWGMLRYQVFLSRMVIGLAIWYAILRSSVNNNNNSSSSRYMGPSIFITYAPIWVILVLGLYAVTVIGMGVFNMRDAPEAATELDQHIIQARHEMKHRGIIVTDPSSCSTDTKKSS